MNAILVAADGGVVSVWEASDLDVKYGFVGGRCDVVKYEGVGCERKLQLASRDQVIWTVIAQALVKFEVGAHDNGTSLWRV